MPKKGCKASAETKKKMGLALSVSKLKRNGRSEQEILENKKAGKKWCTGCQKFHDPIDFPASGGRYCKSSYPKHDPQKTWKYNLSKFGATPEWYHRTLDDQHNGCGICGSSEPGGSGGRFAIDHDHQCCPAGRACDKCRRGLLCAACNTALERLETIPRFVPCANAYLKKFDQSTTEDLA